MSGSNCPWCPECTPRTTKIAATLCPITATAILETLRDISNKLDTLIDAVRYS